jgi:RNA polymerase sigma-70 factor (ECF subfamily)
MADIDRESDESLMVRVQGGDHQAFAILVRRNTQKFFACAYRVCGDVYEAEDVVQDAFLKLWNRPETWNENKGAKFTTWFYRVVTNLAIDNKRKKKPLANNDVLDYMPDSAPRADEAMIEMQEQKLLEHAIQDLPERQKTALNLCFYEGLSNKEAAEIMGVGVKALESLLMRAKAALKEELTKQGLLSNPEGRKRHA